MVLDILTGAEDAVCGMCRRRIVFHASQSITQWGI